MKALQYSRYGEPLDVIELVDLPEPGPIQPHEVLIEVLFTPINPYDLNSASGRVLGPAFPASLGTEGVARVLEAGSEVDAVKPGDLVFVPGGGSNAWRERLAVPAATMFPLPAGADLQQLSMAAVNPTTAGVMLDGIVDLHPGDWIVQNAGNSAVSACVVAYAKARSLHVISLVRRPEAVAEAAALGSDLVFVEGKELKAQVAEAGVKPNARLGLDGVGGRSAMSVASLLGFGGTVAAYSAMSGEPALISPMDSIFRDIRYRGVFLGHPHVRNSEGFGKALREGLSLIMAGKLTVPVGGVYRLEDYRDAIAQSGRGKKILLKPN